MHVHAYMRIHVADKHVHAYRKWLGRGTVLQSTCRLLYSFKSSHFSEYFVCIYKHTPTTRIQIVRTIR